MESFGDAMQWLVGGLAAFAFFGYKARLAADNAKFDRLFVNMRLLETNYATLAAEVKNTNSHFAKTLDEMHEQNSEIAENITAIRISMARMGKLVDDSDASS
jgi:uncharacterized protein YdcH (DUF465 family)